MEKIILGKGEGKTTALISMSAQTGSFIVCRNKETACDIFEYAKSMGLKIPYPITYFEFKRLGYNSRQSILIDDIEAFLQAITPVLIKAFTMDSV